MPSRSPSASHIRSEWGEGSEERSTSAAKMAEPTAIAARESPIVARRRLLGSRAQRLSPNVAESALTARAPTTTTAATSVVEPTSAR